MEFIVNAHATQLNTTRRPDTTSMSARMLLHRSMVLQGSDTVYMLRHLAPIPASPPAESGAMTSHNEAAFAVLVAALAVLSTMYWYSFHGRNRVY
jgi:hypothetical protein